VTGPTIRIVRLAPEHDLEAFDCGVGTYNEWLAQHAPASVRAGICAVYLLVEETTDSSRVVGYYAINPTQVTRSEVPTSFTRGWPDTVPAWKIGKLALHVDLRADRDAQWGRQLLRDALETVVSVADSGGGKVIVVHADNPSLVPFYTRNGFTSTGIPDDLTLFMKVSTARKALAQGDC